MQILFVCHKFLTLRLSFENASSLKMQLSSSVASSRFVCSSSLLTKSKNIKTDMKLNEALMIQRGLLQDKFLMASSYSSGVQAFKYSVNSTSKYKISAMFDSTLITRVGFIPYLIHFHLFFNGLLAFLNTKKIVKFMPSAFRKTSTTCRCIKANYPRFKMQWLETMALMLRQITRIQNFRDLNMFLRKVTLSIYPQNLMRQYIINYHVIKQKFMMQAIKMAISKQHFCAVSFITPP